MKLDILNVRLGLATNSSSSHSIIFFDGRSIRDDRAYGEFGWEYFTAASKDSKNRYVGAALYGNLRRLVSDTEAARIAGEWSGAPVTTDDYIDHQSEFDFPRTFDGQGLHRGFFDDFQKFMLQPNVAILGGNDNDSRDHPLLAGNRRVSLPIPRDNASPPLVCRWDKAQRFWTIFNKETGAKIRFRFITNPDEIEVKPDRASAPELVDVKITNQCYYGCEYCYQDSVPAGKHADHAYLGGIYQALRDMEVFEVACLDGETPIFGPDGLKRAKEIVVGDRIYDGDGPPRRVTRVSAREAHRVILVGSKGWKVICTDDHPFLVGRGIVKAAQLVGLRIDQAKVGCISPSAPIKMIDLTPFVTTPHRAEVGRGGSVGGRIDGHRCRLTNGSVWVDRFLPLTEDLMWLYGLVVAEGSSGSLSLHAKETDLADRALSIYGRIINRSGGKCLPNGSHGMAVEMAHTAIFDSIFFKAMQIPNGAKNKRVSFLFGVDDDLVRAAFQGLFAGDGCFRKKKNGKHWDFVVSLKTASRDLAEEVTFLLYARFGVYASVYQGVCPPRDIYGRSLPATVYWCVEINGKTNILKVFPEAFAGDADYAKLGTSIYSGNKNKNFIKVLDIAPVGRGLVYDITLDDESSHVFQLQHGVHTHNCGGGEPTLHPEFLGILRLFRSHGIVPNFTTRNLAWLNDPKMRRPILENCGAIGFSLDTPEGVAKLHDALGAKSADAHRFVIQVVVGAVSETALEQILRAANKINLRVLLLGYKTTGRGSAVQPEAYDWAQLVGRLQEAKELPTLGIDTALAATSVDRLKALGVPDWKYAIQEGRFSCYVDAVERKIGPSSYCDPSEMKPLPKGTSDEITATFQSFANSRGERDAKTEVGAEASQGTHLG